MKKRVFVILAALLLFFLMSLSIQAYERPPGQEGLRVDDRYEGYNWGDVDGSSNPNGEISDDKLRTSSDQSARESNFGILLISFDSLFGYPIIIITSSSIIDEKHNETVSIGVD